jgi:CDP-diacylglycerol--serine O-phosphatidyltransferase
MAEEPLPKPTNESPEMNETPPGDRTTKRRPQLQRGIIILPSAFTLGNLFFGIFAMVTAAQGDLIWAAWYIVFASIFDFADGRIARFTRTGSSFGAELDSLVDAISFGVAPGFIIYQQFLTETAWGWILSFVYVTAIVVRLARFNVEQGGEAKTHFHGLPSPTAGVILATFYPFSQTPYFQAQLSDLPWPSIMGVLTVVISVLMVSHIHSQAGIQVHQEHGGDDLGGRGTDAGPDRSSLLLLPGHGAVHRLRPAESDSPGLHRPLAGEGPPPG